MPTNNELLERYLNQLRRLKRSPNTIYLYGRELSLFLNATKKPLAAVTLHDCELWLDRPRRKARAVEASPATIKREVMELRSFLKWAYENEYIPKNLAVKLRPPKVENEDPHPVTDEVWLDVWNRDLDDAHRVTLGLGYFTGMRRAEIAYLASSDIVGPKMWIKRKGHTKKVLHPWRSCVQIYAERLPHLIGDPEHFIEALDRLVKARGGRPALLPWDDDKSLRNRTKTKYERGEGLVDPNMIWRKLEPLGIKPHDLRHSFGTNLVRPAPNGAGVPIHVVTRLMGHGDPRITMRYLDTGDDPLADLLGVDATATVEPAISRW